MVQKRLINIRVTEEEDKLLASYAEMMGQTKTEVVRDLIRSLEKRLKAAQNRR